MKRLLSLSLSLLLFSSNAFSFILGPMDLKVGDEATYKLAGAGNYETTRWSVQGEGNPKKIIKQP